MYQLSIPVGQVLSATPSVESPHLLAQDESRLGEIKRRLGFIVRKRQSTIPDAGFGMFVDGVVRQGQVFA